MIKWKPGYYSGVVDMMLLNNCECIRKNVKLIIVNVLLSW